jgi:hypothetical protein
MELKDDRPCDALPNRIIVRNCAIRLDGGTIHLIGTDEAGREFSVMLVTQLPTGRPLGVSGRLYFNGELVPMRSDREAQILRLLSEATIEVPPLSLARREPRITVIGDDIREFFDHAPEENCRAFIRRIVEAVKSEGYLRYTTDEEKVLEDESNRDVWEPRTGKKKRRTWRRRR